MQSDEDLCREMQAGSESSLEVLVHRYHGQIHGFIYRLVRDEDATQDLVQETFIRICTRIKQYRYPEPFRPWLYRIATNICRDYWKSTTYRQRQQSDELGEATEDKQANIASIYDWQETRVEVRKAILGLKDIYREVLVLRFYQDLKLTEIALAMDLPLGTVKWRMFKALELVKNRLAEGGVSDDSLREGDD